MTRYKNDYELEQPQNWSYPFLFFLEIIVFVVIAMAVFNFVISVPSSPVLGGIAFCRVEGLRCCWVGLGFGRFAARPF
jgi:hypothetical protein